MRFVSFLQVLLLLSIAASLLLVTLENPVPVRLPLPLGGGELSLPLGLTVTVFLVLGAAYSTLLLLPPLWRAQARRRREGLERQRVEDRLTATLQARLGSMSGPASTPSGAGIPLPTAELQLQASPAPSGREVV